MQFDSSAGIDLLEVSDVSGQKTATISEVPPDASIGELVEQLLGELRLTKNDSSGRPLTYHARLDREGRHLLHSERVGEALKSGDRLVLQPNIDAGGGEDSLMITAPWRYQIQILGDDGVQVAEVPVTIDWDPVQESLRLAALRRGGAVSEALGLECRVEPKWDPVRQGPFIDGVSAHAVDGAQAGLSMEVSPDYFSAPAEGAVQQLVELGTIAPGTTIRYSVVAIAESAGRDREPEPRFRSRPTTAALAVLGSSRAEFLDRTTANLGTPSEGGNDIAVFVPNSVLEEAGALARGVEGRETGGVLLGQLHRDGKDGDLFLEVTAQVPACHVDASAVHLTFTSDTWTGIRSAIALRQRGEIMVGYWHSHPVRSWCQHCPEEQQRRCAFRSDFYSAADRHLHRTIFPRAYSVALVVNDVGYSEPTFSMFGWREGLIGARGFHALRAAPLLQRGPNDG